MLFAPRTIAYIAFAGAAAAGCTRCDRAPYLDYMPDTATPYAFVFEQQLESVEPPAAPVRVTLRGTMRLVVAAKGQASADGVLFEFGRIGGTLQGPEGTKPIELPAEAQNPDAVVIHARLDRVGVLRDPTARTDLPALAAAADALRLALIELFPRLDAARPAADERGTPPDDAPPVVTETDAPHPAVGKARHTTTGRFGRRVEDGRTVVTGALTHRIAGREGPVAAPAVVEGTGTGHTTTVLDDPFPRVASAVGESDMRTTAVVPSLTPQKRVQHTITRFGIELERPAR